MKTCKYCDTTNPDEATKCKQCGASEFTFKCSNCGTSFETAFCPNCGTKAGAAAKVCPKCKEKYFSAACPSCGYTPAAAKADPAQRVVVVNPTAQKKKGTFWIVLLWIFFLPIMAIIAIWKSKKLPQKWKIILTIVISVITIVYYIVSNTAAGGENSTAKSAAAPTAVITEYKPEHTKEPAKADAAPALTAAPKITDTPEPKATNTPTPKITNTPAPTEAPTATPVKATIGERNALRSAENYLNFAAFSYSGLIGQLEFEGYTTEEATYAVDHCGADWFEQAALSAENYLSFMSFSKSGLIKQLEFEGFTHEQAVYGTEQNGY